MELRQLRYFLKVAALRSFSAASKELFISQSTISQQIKQLEDELQCTLLIRDSRHVDLSDAGREFLPYASRVLQDAEACREALSIVNELSTGTLNIGATYSFWPLLKETTYYFLSKYPHIKLNIYRGSMEEILEKLERDEIDIALSYKPMQTYEDIDSHILFQTELALIVRKGHPRADLGTVQLGELEELQLALPAKGLQARSVMDSILFGTGIKPLVRLEINDVSVLLDLIGSNNMGTLLSEVTIRNRKDLVAIRLDTHAASMTGSYHIKKGHYMKKSAATFLSLLKDRRPID